MNAGIIATLEDEKERRNFWAYNNGMTIVCDDYEHDESSGQLKMTNLSIVNGCQTTVALVRGKKNLADQDISLLARIICPPEPIGRLHYPIYQFPERDQTMGLRFAGCNAGSPKEGI